MRQDAEYWMKFALELAKEAGHRDEVPVGAILVGPEGKILSRGQNIKENLTTPIGHAEIQALHKAAKAQKTWRLSGTTLYVTLEPCLMCAGALIQARVSKVVFGAYDPKGGALSSLYTVGQDPRLNHQIEVLGGILENECSQLLKDFFKGKRGKS
jgi:tRNA(adenine34) deaminase